MTRKNSVKYSLNFKHRHPTYTSYFVIILYCYICLNLTAAYNIAKRKVLFNSDLLYADQFILYFYK